MAKSGKVTFSFTNRSGIVPAVGDTVEGTCTGSAKGLRSLTLIWDPTKGKWSYNGSISHTTLSPMVALAGSPTKTVQGTLQLQVSLGNGGATTPLTLQGAAGQCFDNQYRGSGPGGTGSVPNCKVTMAGAVPSVISCK